MFHFTSTNHVTNSILLDICLGWSYFFFFINNAAVNKFEIVSMHNPQDYYHCTKFPWNFWVSGHLHFKVFDSKAKQDFDR